MNNTHKGTLLVIFLVAVTGAFFLGRNYGMKTISGEWTNFSMYKNVAETDRLLSVLEHLHQGRTDMGLKKLTGLVGHSWHSVKGDGMKNRDSDYQSLIDRLQSYCKEYGKIDTDNDFGDFRICEGTALYMGL